MSFPAVRRQRSARGEILFPPDALAQLTAGFDLLASVIAATLGPTRGPVLNARSGRSVELLADAGAIARRIVAVPRRGQNTGAMMARHLAWQMHEQFGDGAATAVVLARAIVREAMKSIAAGVDPLTIRRGLDYALPVALAALNADAMPVAGLATLKAMARGITGDAALGAVLGEIVDLLGPDAALTIEEFPVSYLDREYVEGAAWRAHPATRAMIPEGSREAVLQHPLLMLVDQPLTTFDDVRPALELAIDPGERRPLLIIPAKIGDQALAAMTANGARGTLTAIAALLSASGPPLSDALADIAALSGGTVLADLLGRPPGRLQREDLGAARRAVITRESLTIVGGDGSPVAIAERSTMLRRRMERLSSTTEEWQRLQGRVAQLGGGSAILKIGAPSGTDLKQKRAQAEKAFRVLVGMSADGVVPGGGVAYLACQPALQAVREDCPAGAERGVDVLLAALEAPFMQIVRNRGLVHPPVALAEAQRRGAGHGFDARGGDYVIMREAGILDSLRVTRGALRLAVSAAVSLLSTGVVVLPSARQAQRVQP